MRVCSDLVGVSSLRPIGDTDGLDVVCAYPAVYDAGGLPTLDTSYYTLIACEHGFTIHNDLLAYLSVFGAFAYSVSGHFYLED